jgi:hypothetical protein
MGTTEFAIPIENINFVSSVLSFPPRKRTHTGKIKTHVFPKIRNRIRRKN